MLPFCGYNMADYWQHWFDMGARLGNRAPRIFYVNWFRKSPAGKWLWPGFGENSRVLKWMCERVEGAVDARATPIGWMPKDGDLDLTGLRVAPEDWAELMRVDSAAMKAELSDLEGFLAKFGEKTPKAMTEQLSGLRRRLNA
jgi:phosphoenolpyruvate carboxykinase (GTP)